MKSPSKNGLLAGFDTDKLLLMEGYDDCIVGVVERFGQPPIVCYDKQLVLLQIATDSGMTEGDAEEWFEYNQIGAWMGEDTPCFISLREPTKTNER
ncbi:hypothetical protein OAE43_01005 [Akkermansiaceae bacterium]|nr:hypothetical protein [Akkermansiaceae bacterium]MDB4792305.1 hypothetical protein [bacterium]